MGPVATAMGEIYQYTLEPARRRRGAAGERDVQRADAAAHACRTGWWRRCSRASPGVTEVNSFGGYIQQFQVVVDPDRLLKYDLSVEAVREADPPQQRERRRQRRHARAPSSTSSAASA